MIQIHHIVPKGWWRYTRHTDPNTPFNGIALCTPHHVGKGYRGTLEWRDNVVPVIHPDMEWARRNYQGNTNHPTSYEVVFEGRNEITRQGKTYWNVDWDAALETIARETVFRYMAEHPEDPFPRVNHRAVSLDDMLD